MNDLFFLLLIGLATVPPVEKIIVEFPTVKSVPNPMRTTPGRAAGYGLVVQVALGLVLILANRAEKTPGWLEWLLGLIDNDYRLNRRYRRRSCECCSIVARRVQKYLGSDKIKDAIAARGLPGNDDVKRVYALRKSNAN